MKKILLIGDSIRAGYDKYVKMAFKEVAEVYYPMDNCRFASYIVRGIGEWKERLDCGDDVDLVYWNAGLWDNLIMVDGEHHTPLNIYKMYIGRICNMIKILFPDAKIIFATSTPVQEESSVVWAKRYNSDTELYNAAATEVVKEHGGDVDDLYELTKNAPSSNYSDGTHFYTKEGTRLLANHVIHTIEMCLEIQAEELDYDELFSETKNVIGI